MTDAAYPDPVVFDPGIPEPARKVLAANQHLLPPPSATSPRPRFGGRNLRVAGLALLQAPLWVYLPALACWPNARWWIRLTGIAAQAAVITPIALYGVPGFAVNTLVGVPLQAIAWVILMAVSGEPTLPKLIRRHQQRYLRPTDLDGPGRTLLRRAQAAVDTVFHSHVHREGLLDEVRNAVTLPHQLWDVAQTVAELSRLRGEQARGSLGLNTPRVTDALRPQLKALQLATESVTKRIQALEAYAARTLAADQALLELHALKTLAENNDDYRELLARTVHDELALAEINDLTERARQIEEALHASVEQARKAGLSLVPHTSIPQAS
jgi:hypothetical protein